MIFNKNKKRLISSIILTPLIFFIIYFGGNLFNFFLFSCLAITIFEWYKFRLNKIILCIGILYLFFSFFLIYLMRGQENIESIFYFYLVTIICISTDIGGFIFGNIFKGPKLTKISPNKTYSGFFGAIILSLISFSAVNYFFNNNILDNEINYYIIIISISIISQLGDLIISFFKRKANIKDTGNIIPGHGGILDRIDGIIFAFPFSYLFFY